MRRFPHATRHDGEEVVFEWNGNAGHSNATKEDVKGYYTIIVPAWREADVRLNVAEYSTCKLPFEEMHEFYCKSNVALCASSYEGCSSSVLEAMACGLAVIATDVGNHREMQESQVAEYGESGILLVDRSTYSFTRAMEELVSDPKRVARMGELNRMEIIRAWSWDAWAERFAAFLRKGLRSS